MNERKARDENVEMLEGAKSVPELLQLLQRELLSVLETSLVL